MLSLGPVEPDTVEKVEIIITDEEKARQERISLRPSLDEVLNLHDFEVSLSLPCFRRLLTDTRPSRDKSCQIRRGRIILRLQTMKSPIGKTMQHTTGIALPCTFGRFNVNLGFLQNLVQAPDPSRRYQGGLVY